MSQRRNRQAGQPVLDFTMPDTGEQVAREEISRFYDDRVTTAEDRLTQARAVVEVAAAAVTEAQRVRDAWREHGEIVSTYPETYPHHLADTVMDVAAHSQDSWSAATQAALQPALSQPAHHGRRHGGTPPATRPARVPRAARSGAGRPRTLQGTVPVADRPGPQPRSAGRIPRRPAPLADTPVTRHATVCPPPDPPQWKDPQPWTPSPRPRATHGHAQHPPRLPASRQGASDRNANQPRLGRHPGIQHERTDALGHELPEPAVTFTGRWKVIHTPSGLAIPGGLGAGAACFAHAVQFAHNFAASGIDWTAGYAELIANPDRLRETCFVAGCDFAGCTHPVDCHDGSDTQDYDWDPDDF